jgi:hypothetical protein
MSESLDDSRYGLTLKVYHPKNNLVKAIARRQLAYTKAVVCRRVSERVYLQARLMVAQTEAETERL